MFFVKKWLDSWTHTRATGERYACTGLVGSTDASEWKNRTEEKPRSPQRLWWQFGKYSEHFPQSVNDRERERLSFPQRAFVRALSESGASLVVHAKRNARFTSVVFDATICNYSVLTLVGILHYEIPLVVFVFMLVFLNMWWWWKIVQNWTEMWHRSVC